MIDFEEAEFMSQDLDGNDTLDAGRSGSKVKKSKRQLRKEERARKKA